jgi:hypothetical protein
LNVTDKLAEVIMSWTNGQPRYAEVPANAVLAADLDFAPTETAWTIARNRLVDEGVIGRDGSYFYVL